MVQNSTATDLNSQQERNDCPGASSRRANLEPSEENLFQLRKNRRIYKQQPTTAQAADIPKTSISALFLTRCLSHWPQTHRRLETFLFLTFRLDDSSLEDLQTKNMVERKIDGGVAHKMPADLRKSLISAPEARAAWEDITPLARNEWICWIESAKNSRQEILESKGHMRCA